MSIRIKEKHKPKSWLWLWILLIAIILLIAALFLLRQYNHDKSDTIVSEPTISADTIPAHTVNDTISLPDSADSIQVEEPQAAELTDPKAATPQLEEQPAEPTSSSSTNEAVSPTSSKSDNNTTEIKEQPKVVLSPPKHTYFDYDSYQPKNLAALDDFIAKLKANPQPITINGYADMKGTDAYNITLSQKRADAVKNYLISKGIPASNITTYAHGRSNTYPEQYLNRRVEILLN